MNDWLLYTDNGITNDVIDWESDFGKLGHTVNRAVKLIQHRIYIAFGRVDYEMAVICHSDRKGYLFSEYPGAEIIIDDNAPFDTIFILCKSVDGRQIIHPADPKQNSDTLEWIDWAEYFYRMMLYTTGSSDILPRLAVDVPYLQARIKIE